MSPWVIFPLSGRSSGRWRFGFVPLLPVLASVAGYSVTPFGGVCISSLGMGFSRFRRPASGFALAVLTGCIMPHLSNVLQV